MQTVDYVIVGGGIIGLTTAYTLKQQDPSLNIAIIEKEKQVALHASGRNSGVIHAGIYYAHDSLKAQFCLQGNHLLKDFCEENEIPVNRCGKLIVAKDANEHQALLDLYHNAKNNGAQVSLIDQQEVAEIDQHVLTFQQAIWSPETASIDPLKVCHTLEQCLLNQGVQFYLGHEVIGVETKRKVVQTKQKQIAFNTLINSAGLYADQIAKSYHLGEQYQLLPFKGYYYIAKSDAFDLKTNVYPVPNPAYPFLGVHFTITASGKVKVGPTAVPVFWKEQYQGFEHFALREFLDISAWYLKSMTHNHFGFRQLAMQEAKYLMPKQLLKEAQKLVNINCDRDLFEKSRPGIRAQLFDTKAKKLVNDFVMEQKDDSWHILNAVSPAFTCSFSMAQHLVKACAQ